MNHEQLVLKAVYYQGNITNNLIRRHYLAIMHLLSDSLLKAAIDEMILFHAEEPEFIPDEPADEYESEPEYYEYEHYNDYLWNM